MKQELTIETERVDDVPVLLAQMRHMGLAALIDQQLPPHGNWGGVSPGMVVVWLSYILSRGDHRLSHVQTWVGQRRQTLTHALGLDEQISELDFSDDRLGCVLRLLSKDDRWAVFEEALTARLVRVYALEAETVRIDTTSASGYFDVSERGLFQFGHSKDHRPDLPQVKVTLSTPDPLGLPVASEVVAGHRADDPLYIPAIERVHKALARRGLLYVGDCKMAALATRVFLVNAGDSYLCPLAKRQCPQTQGAPGACLQESSGADRVPKPLRSARRAAPSSPGCTRGHLGLAGLRHKS